MNNRLAEGRSINRRQRLHRLPMDGQAVKRLTMAGFTWLKTNQQILNALNVFPVPDGDTGTNMVLTMQAAMDELSDPLERHTGKMLASVAQGALMGARGNSGVILSQLWRGFARALDDHSVLTAEGLVEAFAEARDTAYKGVVRPVEGTILTVAKDIASATEEALNETDKIVDILEIAVIAAKESVERTPELLPVLKDAGVVDSGGKGLFFLLEGMARWIQGEPLDTAHEVVQTLSLMDLESTLDAVEEGQDYEVVVDFKPDRPLNLDEFYSDLEAMGTSIQIGEGEDMYRMHIHVPTEKRYEPIDYTMTIGTVTNVTIENLMAQMEAIEKQAETHQIELALIEPDQIAVVAISPGRGISRIFASMGVAALVEGSQTMNPSTQQILEAFENLPNTQVIILPNNKNIIMAAEAAAEINVKDVRVVKTRSVPQGFAAMGRLAPKGDIDKVSKEMTKAYAEIETGEITTATRNVEIDGVKVKKGQIIALHNDRLVLSAKSLKKGCLGLLEKIGVENFGNADLFYGANVEKSEVKAITKAIKKAYPELDVNEYEGGQQHYQFIFSIE
ncbi:MAG: DAK2 domain-containing protein [Chloroflexi bacterium]|nr:DAK2 domain-containing protein [Chloroflexota bacterium]